MHAAKHYGVDAVGITRSEAQAALAGERIAAAGLSDRCQGGPAPPLRPHAEGVGRTDSKRTTTRR